MIKINFGNVEINGNSNVLINEIAIGIMSVCEEVSESTGKTEEEILDYVLTSLTGQKLARAGMSIEDTEEITGFKVDRAKTTIANKGEER